MRSLILWTVLASLAGHALAGPQAKLKLTVTNGGTPVYWASARFSVFPAGDRKKSIASDHSTRTAIFPAGTYDVRVAYREGAAVKELLIESLKCDGPVERTVELGIVLAQVKILVLNDGEDVKHRGWFELHPPGRCDAARAHGRSGTTISREAGPYDIGAFYEDVGDRDILWKAVPLAGDVVSAPCESPPAR